MLNIKSTKNYYKIIKLENHENMPYKIFGDRNYKYFIVDDYLVIINAFKYSIASHFCRIIYKEFEQDEYICKKKENKDEEILNSFPEVISELERLKNMITIDIICNKFIINLANEFNEIFNRNNIDTNIYCINNLDEYKIEEDNYVLIFTPQHYFVTKNNINNLEEINSKCKCIYYNMEQMRSRLSVKNKEYNKQYFQLTNNLILNSLVTFDYNKDNLDYFNNIIYLPPPIITNNVQCEKMYDILLIGLVNNSTRRKPILDSLKRFFKIKIVYDKIGDELTEIINQSKVVLNLHYYNENTLLEEVRLNEIINSDTHILSELPHIDVDAMKEKYKDRVTFINIIEKPNKIIKKTDPIVVELKKLLKKPNKKYEHNFNNDLTEKILIENIRGSIEEYKKYNEYPHLFHKYLLKIKNPNAEITYNIEKENKYKNFYVKNFAHLHCYDISKFHEIYDEYLDTIDKYFNIIITYSIGEIKHIDYTIIKIPNKGMDVGAKFCMIKYLNDKKLVYDYVMFLHSKSCPKTRKKYFQIVEDLNDNFIKNIHDYDSYFPDIKWEIIDGRLKMLSGNPEYENSNLPERNLLYRNEILKYLNCDNDTNIFTEGNVYILKNNIINKLFTDKYLYNILNESYDFDYNWITYRYGIKGDIKQVYDEFKLKKLKPRETWSRQDGYIEHVFERIIMNLCEIIGNEINLIGLKNINVSIKDNLFLFKNYLNKLNNNTKINIYDISEINKINHRIKTIFCIQPYEITNIRPYLSYFHKPEVLWVWEFKSLPQIFKDYEKYFSKVYTQSQFCYDVFSKHLSIPIQKVELNSMIFEYIDKISGHEIVNKKINNILENTKEKFIYGFCFDLNSSILRKNPLNLVKAFNNLNDEKKVLILKYRPPRSNKFINNIENDIYNSFITEVKKNKNIYCITDELEPLDLYKLYTNFDYYISPHCGEGFGFTIYDNMLLGNKIISPYYSGETEYLNREEIIELEYDEKDIPGLREHPVYGQMTDYKAAYISVESIEKCLDFLKYNNLIKEQLDIYIILKNNEYYVTKILPNIINELQSNFKCRWFIYENNSSDNTKNNLKILFENLNAILLLEEEYFDSNLFNRENCQYIELKMNDKKNKYMKIGYRCEKIAIARERCKKLCKDSKAKWSLLLDTDVILNYEKTIKPLIESREKLSNGKMFCSYTTTCLPYPEYTTNDLENIIIYKGNRYIFDYYYDTFAYNWGEYLWCTNFRDIIEGKFGDKEYLKVKSAFGGCVLIESNTLHKSTWNTICDDEMKSYNGYKIYGALEHYNFCKDVKKHGDIYIVKESKGIWLNDNLINDENLLNLNKSIFGLDNIKIIKTIGYYGNDGFQYNHDIKYDGLHQTSNIFSRYKIPNKSDYRLNMIAGEIYKFHNYLPKCNNNKNGLYLFIEDLKAEDDLEKLINKKIDMCFLPMKFMKDCFSEKIQNKIFISPFEYFNKNIINTNNIKIKDKSDITIGLLGTPTDRKNFKNVIEICIKNKIKVILHCSYFYSEEMKLEYYNLSKSSDFFELSTEKYSEEELINFWNKINIYVFPSKGEGYSKTVRESILNKKICILSDIPAHHNITSTNLVKTIKTTKGEKNYNVDDKDIEDSIKDVINNYENYENKKLDALKWLLNLNVSNETFVCDSLSNLCFKYTIPYYDEVIIWFPYQISEINYHGSQTAMLQFIELFQSFGKKVTIVSRKISNINWEEKDVNYFRKIGIETILINDTKLENISEVEVFLENKKNYLYFAYNPEMWEKNVHLPLTQKSCFSIGNYHDINDIKIILHETVIKNNQIVFDCNKLDNFKDLNVYLNNKIVELLENAIDYKKDLVELFNATTTITYLDQNFYLKKTQRPSIYIPFTLKFNNRPVGEKIVIVASSNPYNITGLRYFISNILPNIPTTIKIYLYGSITWCPEFKEHFNEQLINGGIYNNISEVYENTRFAICITLLGTGLKIKIEESIANNVPIIGYSYQAKWTSLEHYVNGLIFDTEEEYINNILKLSYDDNLLLNLKNNCKETTSNNNFYFNQNSKMLNPKKTCLLFFHICFIPSSSGCQTLSRIVLDELLNNNYKVIIVSQYKLKDNGVTYKWNDETLNELKKKNVDVVYYNNSMSNHELLKIYKPLILKSDCLRIAYDSNLFRLNSIYNSNPEIFKNKRVILDTHDNLELNQKLQKKIKNKEEYLNIKHYYDYIKNFKNTYITSCKDIFTDIVSLNNDEYNLYRNFFDSKTKVYKYNYAQITKSIKHTDRNKIIFVASNNIFNIQAFHVLEEKIMPLLDDDIKIEIYGGLKSKVKTNNNKLKLMGFVDNIDDVYKNALFSICPIIAGTGQKIKILESLSYNIPIVTFQINNIDILEHQTNCFIAENEHEFANYINYIHKHSDIAVNMNCNKLPLELYEKSKKDFYSLL